MPTPTVPRKNRILLIDRHACFTDALSVVLTDARYHVQQLSIRPDLTSAAYLYRPAIALKPEVALLDLNLGNGSDGIDLINPLTRRGVDVVVLTGSEDRARWGQAIEQGACTVLSKTRPLGDLLTLLRRIQRGQVLLSTEERDSLLTAWQGKSARHRVLSHLTPRERVVLAALMEGNHVPSIALAHHVTEATVRSQVKTMTAKTGVKSQLALVCLAYKMGWTWHVEP